MLSKSEKTLLPQQNTKEVKKDMSIVKLNFSNFQRSVITWFKCAETPKNRSLRDRSLITSRGGGRMGSKRLDFGGSILKMHKMLGGQNIKTQGWHSRKKLSNYIMIEATPCFLQK